MDRRSLQDRVVIVVTGAGRGLGLAYALDLAAQRGEASSSTRDPRPHRASPPRPMRWSERITGDAAARRWPVRLAVEQVDGAGDRLLDGRARPPSGRIDGLINNAGVP